MPDRYQTFANYLLLALLGILMVLSVIQLFQSIWAVPILALTTFGLCVVILRNKTRYLKGLGEAKQSLQFSLNQHERRREEMSSLNRGIRQMSETLEPNEIFEGFVNTVTSTFNGYLRVAIFAAQKNGSEGCSLIMTHSNAPTVFKARIHIKDRAGNRLMLGEAISPADSAAKTTVCDLYLQNEKSSGLCYKLERIQSEVYGYVVFVHENFELITAEEGALVHNLVKHLDVSLQNALLVRRVEDSNKSKSAFLANMSHEIRTPLNALMGFCEMLVRADMSERAKQELLVSINSNGQQLIHIIDDLLDLAKIEAGKTVVLTRSVKLISVLREVQNIMEVRAKEKLLDLDFQLMFNLPEVIETDAIRLKQILMNIIGNAIKFTNVGFVKVTVRAVTQNIEYPQIEFLIEDSGIGISDDMKQDLFRPFHQGDSSATRRFGGTGLGLAISRRLAEDLGGDLTLHSSRMGVGSTFSLRIASGTQISLEDKLSSAKRDVIQKSPSIGNVPLKDRRVLLAEDSLDNQDFFTYYLTRAGATVEVVSDGLEAVFRARKTDFDLILMDIQMPGIDGKEATRRIRKNGYRGPIVALTAHAMIEEKESCMHAGCSGHISKPVSGDQLVSDVYAYCQKHEEQSQIRIN